MSRLYAVQEAPSLRSTKWRHMGYVIADSAFEAIEKAMDREGLTSGHCRADIIQPINGTIHCVEDAGQAELFAEEG